jgi:hypothetical protein
MFIGCSLATAISSGSNILIFQLPWHIARSLRLIVSSSLKVYCHLIFWFMRTELPKVAGAPTAPVHTQAVGNVCFHLGGGWPLHIILTLLFHRLIEDLTVSFTTSSCRVFLKAMLSIHLLSRRSCRFTAWSLLLLLNALPDPPRT